MLTGEQIDGARGVVECVGCGGWWEWPGTFHDEHEARAWTREHRRICGPIHVRRYE